MDPAHPLPKLPDPASHASVDGATAAGAGLAQCHRLLWGAGSGKSRGWAPDLPPDRHAAWIQERAKPEGGVIAGLRFPSVQANQVELKRAIPSIDCGVL
jgi:hypothetical protein